MSDYDVRLRKLMDGLIEQVPVPVAPDESRFPRVPRHTPPRSVRIPNDLWEAAKVRAEERGETVTDVITRCLKRYVR